MKANLGWKRDRKIRYLRSKFVDLEHAAKIIRDRITTDRVALAAVRQQRRQVLEALDAIDAGPP
jgi:hypothetical protein